MNLLYIILIYIILLKILQKLFKKQFKVAWLVNKITNQQFKKVFKNYLKGELIDIGCGVKPYYRMTQKYVKNHIGLDHINTFHNKDNIDLFGTAYKIPSKSNMFDSAIGTATLEHLEEPEAALRECYRVLKIGGFAIYTVPFIWHLHEEPRDFYRYSKYGLEYLFTKVGFKIIELNALSGFWVTFGQLLVYKIYKYNKGFIKITSIIPLISFIIQRICYLINKIDKDTRWTWMYLIIVKK